MQLLFKIFYAGYLSFSTSAISLNQMLSELIIRECAKICDERALSAPMGSDEQCEAEDCAQAIIKQFGVKK